MEVNGKTLHFSAAVIATGATPAVPPIKGLKVGNTLQSVPSAALVLLRDGNATKKGQRKMLPSWRGQTDHFKQRTHQKTSPTPVHEDF